MWLTPSGMFFQTCVSPVYPFVRLLTPVTTVLLILFLLIVHFVSLQLAFLFNRHLTFVLQSSSITRALVAGRFS